LFHSAADASVSVGGSDAIFDRLKQLKGEVTYTRYRSLTHVAAWERAYDSTMLYDWFLRQ
jgi:predicted peptidase